MTILEPSMVPSCVGQAISLSDLVKMQSAAASVATTAASAATGIQHTAFGGAVIQYATLDARSGSNLQQTAKIVSTGQCARQVTPPCSVAPGAGYAMNASYPASAYASCPVYDTGSGG